MNTWFEVAVNYEKMDDSGRIGKVSESYLLDAVSFTEAESRVHKELSQVFSGEFKVKKISQTRIAEIIPSDNGDRWFRSKVTFITVDEESGKEKRTAQQVLVYAGNIKDAFDNIIEAMKGMMADFEISSISESVILDVFPYSESNGESQEED